MNVAQLAKLNRALKDILLLAGSRDDRKLSAGQVAIFQDVYKNSPTTIQDVTRRTNLAQSFVSKTISRMKQKNIVRLRQSRADKRKTIITFNTELSDFVQEMSELSILNALEQFLQESGSVHAHRVEALLDELLLLLAGAKD